ncbi:MAG TPA: aminoacyl-tRNA hydrolase [Candidatus Onthoplasma faecigallinarum]|nr:aminoacyl-tRNA hydrolase [Candidatus Onthoplasma faecigallinarum]
MKIIVGLGNPEGKYNNTYHNVGFSVVDLFAKQNDLKFSQQKCRALLAKGEDFILAKPQTYMNLSGDSVYELKKYFKVPLENILIVLDDIDMPKGKIRFRQFGSAGTHNGLRDIVNKVGITPRLRIGIGRDTTMDLADYVLSNIDEKSKQTLNETYLVACDLIKKFINGELCQDTTI